jgi:nucleoside-diphosphate-sugar epimerase
MYLVRPDREDAETLRATLTLGPGRLIEAFRAKGLRPARFVLGSSVEVFGDRGGEWVDEDSELGVRSLVGDALLDAESSVRDAKIPSTILRFGETYGSDRPGLLSALRPGAPPLTAPRAHANLVHRDDAVEAAVLLSTTKRRVDEVYVVVDREPTPRLEVVAWLAERGGVPIPPVDGSATQRADVRAMSDRLVEAGFQPRYPTYREGYRSLLARR